MSSIGERANPGDQLGSLVGALLFSDQLSEFSSVFHSLSERLVNSVIVALEILQRNVFCQARKLPDLLDEKRFEVAIHLFGREDAWVPLLDSPKALAFLCSIIKLPVVRYVFVNGVSVALVLHQIDASFTRLNVPHVF